MQGVRSGCRVIKTYLYAMNIRSMLEKLSDAVKPLLTDDDEAPADDKEEQVEENMAEMKKNYNAKDILAAIFNGLDVGLLLRLLLGLSASLVASAFIGTLSSALVLLLGLNEKLFNVVKSIRIGSFGIFAVAGILLGFYIRSHSPLAPSLGELKSEYLELGYADEEAREFIAYQEFGLIPESWKGRIAVENPAVTPTDTAEGSSQPPAQMAMTAQTVNVSKRNNVLFSSSVNVGDCRMLESSHAEMSFKIIQFNYSGVGGTWKELAENMDIDLPEEVKVKVLILARDVICGASDKGTIKIKCPTLDAAPETYSSSELKSRLSEADPFWKNITERIDNEIDAGHHAQIYAALIKTFCHD